MFVSHVTCLKIISEEHGGKKSVEEIQHWREKYILQERKKKKK